MRIAIRSCVLLLMSVGMCAAPVRAAEGAKPPSESALRTAMNRAESRFFELYNEVNEDRRHDLACESEDMTGSRLRKKRTCRTRGEADASATAAREYLRNLNLLAADAPVAEPGQVRPSMEPDRITPSSGTEPTDSDFAEADAKVREERAAFEKHLQELLAKHPELRQRFDEYMLARGNYQAARKK